MKEKDMWVVTCVKEPSEENIGVEIAGVFNLEENAYAAKAKVSEWLEKEGFEDAEVFVGPQEINRLAWYDIEEVVE